MHLATLLQHRVGDDAHGAIVTPAVHELEIVPHQHRGKIARRRCVGRAVARVGSAINADSLQQ